MKRTITIVTATALLLAGCASPASQQALANLQAQCAAGNPDACTAASFQAQANQQEAAQNGQTAATGLAVLGIIGAVVGAAAVSSGNDHHYRHYRR